MKIINIIILLISLSINNIYALKLQKHYMDAKLFYINSDFEKAKEECQIAFDTGEINEKEAQMFNALLKFVEMFSKEKYNEALKNYNQKKYLKALTPLSEILRKNSKDEKAISLYKKILTHLTEKEKNNLIKKIDKEIERNKKLHQEAILISLYTEKLIINPNDRKTKLELERVRFKYNSAQTKKEIKKMITELKNIIANKPIDFEKGYVIVNNILYIDKNNSAAKKYKKLLDIYKKEEEERKKKLAKKKSYIKKVVIKEHKKERKEKKEFKKNLTSKTKISYLSISNIIKMKKNIVKKEKLNKKVRINKAKVHFNRGVNRYNKKLYKEAKEEFVIAKYYNPLLKKADIYIKKCEIEEKKLKKHKNKIVKKKIETSKKLIKKKKIEKAISLLYNTMISNNIENKEGEKYLQKIIKKHLKEMKEKIESLDPFYNFVKYLNDNIDYYTKLKEYEKAVIFIETLAEIYPENKKIIQKWKNYIIKLRNKKSYLKKLYQKSLIYFYNGDYQKTLLYLTLLSNFKNIINDKDFANLTLIKDKCKKGLNKLNSLMNKLSQIYNSAIFDYMHGDYITALQKWEYILKVEPWNIKARFNINKVHNILNGRNNISLTQYLSEKKLKIVNKYYYNGLLSYNKGNYKKALNYFRKALEIFPSFQKSKNNIEKLKILMSMSR